MPRIRGSRQPRGLRCRTRLLRAALELFSHASFEAVSLRDLAAHSGVNSSLVSFHFGGKDGLYLAAMRLACRMGRRTMPAPPASGAPAAKALAALAGRLGTVMMAARRIRDGASGDPGAQALALVARGLTAPPGPARSLALDLVEAHEVHLRRCLDILAPGLEASVAAGLGRCLQGRLLLEILGGEGDDRMGPHGKSRDGIGSRGSGGLDPWCPSGGHPGLKIDDLCRLSMLLA